MHRKPAYLTLGSGRESEIALEGWDLERPSARIEYNDGFVVDNPSLDTVVDGVNVGAQRFGPIDDYGVEIYFGAVRLDLYDPKLVALHTQPLHDLVAGRPYVLGSDRALVDVHVDHRSISGQHARVDLKELTVTDVGSEAGVRLVGRGDDRKFVGERIAPNCAVSFADFAGVFLGDVWIPATVLRGDAWARSSGEGAPRTVVLGLPKGPFKIGRSSLCQVVVPFPQVSKEHAEIVPRSDGRVTVKDLGATNGTFVDGRRLRKGEVVVIQRSQRLMIGPYPFRLDRPDLNAELDARIDVEAIDVGIDVSHPEGPEHKVAILDRVSFKALPGDCIALMGPSGAGKTTLLETLLHVRRPTRCTRSAFSETASARARSDRSSSVRRAFSLIAGTRPTLSTSRMMAPTPPHAIAR